MRNCHAVSIVMVAMAADVGYGQEMHLVVPAALENAEGAVSNTIPLGASGGGTYQVVYAENELTAMPPGSRITAFQLRVDNVVGFSGWPNSASTVADYRVYFGQATRTPANISGTFALNIADKQLVRSGNLALAVKAYPGGSPLGGPLPRAWGPVLALDTEYSYVGGPLAIEFRNQGVTPASVSAADCINNDARAAGGGNSSGSEATTSNGGSALIIRLTYVASATCPADLNNDGQVDDADFVSFVFAYNVLDCADPTMPAGCPADFNGDDVVEDGDFVVFVAAYNELVCP